MAVRSEGSTKVRECLDDSVLHWRVRPASFVVFPVHSRKMWNVINAMTPHSVRKLKDAGEPAQKEGCCGHSNDKEEADQERAPKSCH